MDKEAKERVAVMYHYLEEEIGAITDSLAREQLKDGLRRLGGALADLLGEYPGLELFPGDKRKIPTDLAKPGTDKSVSASRRREYLFDDVLASYLLQQQEDGLRQDAESVSTRDLRSIKPSRG